MFCPGCGVEDLSANQFCRSCGADLRGVRAAVTDTITVSAATARNEIGAAVAARIREIRSAAELSTVTEEVLPQIEKFLESPAERRLRRMRIGTILASIGLGAAIAMSFVSIVKGQEDLLFLAGLGLVAFFIGLGFILNGIFLTVPRHGAAEAQTDTEILKGLDIGANDLQIPAPPARDLFSSVTEHTTKHLKGRDKT
ncbi:MAG: zinc ribbon domain-containing protein [Chloracidobacterium sp.]|nr:zinc ribbon domain-containing protein [Chloracidobacterium sp.]